MIISYDYDSNVKQNLSILDKMMEVYFKITKSDKKIAIISDEEWEKLKKEYIENLKNGVKYEVHKEPDVVLEEIKKDDIISNSAIDLFGDIVEVEQRSEFYEYASYVKASSSFTKRYDES